MVNLTREASLLEPVADYIRRKGFRLQEAELGFYEYRVDLYGFSSAQNKTIAIELKINNWQRAFQQTILYQLCADQVYIAMPHAVIRRVDTELLGVHGIGLIAVGEKGRCRQVLEATQSSVVRAKYKEDYIEFLRGRI